MHRKITVTDLLEDAKTNPYMLTFYASRKCKVCLGRGVKETSVPEGKGWVVRQDTCSCVVKKMKKELANA